MTPGKYDLIIYCGATLNADSLVLTYKIDGEPVDLAGYVVTASGTSSWDGKPLFELSSLTGGLVLGASIGTFWPNVTAEQTTAMWRQSIPLTRTPQGEVAGKAGTWILELRNPNSANDTEIRLLEGAVYLSPGAGQR